MMNSSVKNRRVDRISILLQEYNIEKIIHIKGQHNCLADYLSRHSIHYEEEIFNEDYGISMLFDGEPPKLVYVPDNKSSFIIANVTRSKKKEALQHESLSITPSTINENNTTPITKKQLKNKLIKSSSSSFTCNYFNIDQLKIEQSKDPVIQNTIKETQKNLANTPYVLHEGLLYKLVSIHQHSTTKIKLIYLPSSMINSLLQAYHTDPLGGHFCMKRTYLKLKNKFWCPGMRQSITQYIKSCLPCQQYNISRIKKPGRLCPIVTPEGPFQMIGIDFCGPFKRTPRDNQYVLCITNYFMRWIIAIALPDYSAQTTAHAIFDEYICRYGVPLSILSDQGTHFNNQLMDSMAKLIGYNHIYSTVYHPQSNGMVERFNAIFVPQVAKLQDRESSNWDEYLSPVVFAYNTGVHSTTCYSPYQLQFGREPRLPTDKTPFHYVFHKPNDYYNQLRKSLQIFHQYAQNHIQKQQTKYKNNYDKNRSDPHYEIKDKVLIKIHGVKSKLDPRYSLIPKLIIRKQHPIYCVQDEITKNINQVHVNDIRPVLF